MLIKYRDRVHVLLIFFSGTTLVLGDASKGKGNLLEEFFGLLDSLFILYGGICVLLGELFEILDLGFRCLGDARQIVDQRLELFCLATDIQCQFLYRIWREKDRRREGEKERKGKGRSDRL